MNMRRTDELTPVNSSSVEMKHLGAKWLVQMYDHLSDNPHLLVNDLFQLESPTPLVMHLLLKMNLISLSLAHVRKTTTVIVMELCFQVKIGGLNYPCIILYTRLLH